MGYRIVTKKNYLMHKGKKGMKWGFNDGKRNGKRTADDFKNSYDAEEYIKKLDSRALSKMSPSEFKEYKKILNKTGWSKSKKRAIYERDRAVRSYHRNKDFNKAIERKNAMAKLGAKYAIGKVKVKDTIDGGIRKIKKAIKNPITTKTTHTYLDNSGYTETYNHRTKKKTVKNFKNNKKWKVKKVKPSK